MAERMIVRGMRERTDQRPALASLGQHRQMLANLDAGRLGADGLELAPDVLRRVGLHVKTIVLGQPAGEEDVDARLGLACGLNGAVRRTCLAQPGHVVYAEA